MYANIFCTTQILLLNYSIKNLLRTHLHSHTTHFFTHFINFQQLIKLPYFYKNILDYFFNRLMIYMDLDSSSAAAAVDYNQEKHVFHVLAVDDSHIDRKLLERLLTVSSYQVTCVDSGDKALEYLGLMDNIKNNEYEISPTSSSTSTISYESSSKSTSSQQEVSKVNLIMTDYSMPGITGYDLLKRIKDSSWKDVPVVVMSSENVPSRINMCLEEGAEEFLLKPVKLSDVKKIHSHLLKCTITAHPCDQTTSVDDNLAICNDETTTSNDTNRDDNENDKNCSNASKRKATLTTSSDRRPRVQELPVS